MQQRTWSPLPPSVQPVEPLVSMYLRGTRSPPSVSSYSARYAAVAPLPSDPADHGHYLMRSGRMSQSEPSVSDSDGDEEESAGSSSAGSDSDAESSTRSDERSDTESETHASLGSRSASESSFSDAEPSFAVHLDDSTSAMRLGVWHSDNLGVVGLLIPITGVSTMALTEILACAYHFDCSKEYPTLSYAAEFKPEGHAFTIGMCTTAIFILTSVALFHWFVRLKLFHPSVDQGTVVVTHGCLASGVMSSSTLFGLAVFDMGAYHDTHIVFTVLFFISAWMTIGTVQGARRCLLRERDEGKAHRATAVAACAQLGGAPGLWFALQRWKRISIRDAYQIGQLFTYAGLSATGLFALLFLCVNGVWPNPFGFTAVQEALLEAFAIFCQLFFMGTLSCELSMLTRVVEHRDYQELERAE